MEKPGVFSTPFSSTFPFQLGGNSALEMVGRTAKDAGNLVDLFHGGCGPESGPESGPLSLMPHVLIAKLVEGWRR